MSTTEAVAATPIAATIIGTSQVTADLGPEHWRDWFPEDTPSLTIEELVAKSDSLEVEPVTATTIRAWQRARLLPLPARRREGTRTVAVYPAVALAVIERIRQMQGTGLTLDQIRPLLRGMVRSWSDPDPLGLEPAIREAARMHEAIAGLPVTWAVVTFTTVVGTAESYAFELTPR